MNVVNWLLLVYFLLGGYASFHHFFSLERTLSTIPDCSIRSSDRYERDYSYGETGFVGVMITDGRVKWIRDIVGNGVWTQRLGFANVPRQGHDMIATKNLNFDGGFCRYQSEPLLYS